MGVLSFLLPLAVLLCLAISGLVLGLTWRRREEWGSASFVIAVVFVVLLNSWWVGFLGLVFFRLVIQQQST